MTDAELVYDALLRAERRLQLSEETVIVDIAMMRRLAALTALQTLREEIGRGLSGRALGREGKEARDEP